MKVNIYLTTMENFTAMNKVYDTFFEHPKPVLTLLNPPRPPLTAFLGT